MKITDPVSQAALSTPGVYQIYCVISCRSLFREAANMYEDFSNICNKLEIYIYENEDLQEDYRRLGDDCFRIDVLDDSDEMKDPVKRKEKLEESIRDWAQSADVY